MNDRISVARLLELGTTPTWQEAVAVTLEAALGAVGTRINGQPVRVDAEACVLTAAGEVVLAVEAATPTIDGPQQLLRALLVGIDAPAELISVAYGSRPDQLTDDLAQFSRPNRRLEIGSLATRALALEQKAAAHEPPPVATTAEVASPPPPPASTQPPERLSEMLHKASGRKPAPPRPPRQKQLKGRARRASEVVAASAVLLALGLAGWLAWTLNPSAPEPLTGTRDTAQVDQAPAPLEPDPRWTADGQRTADIVLDRRAPRAAPSAEPTTGRAGTTADAGPRLATPEAATPVASTSAIRPPGPLAAPPPSPPPALEAEFVDFNAAAFDEGLVYTGTNAGVAPPVMIQPRMPRWAFPEATETLSGPYVEVLVNEAGAVDAVRLRGRADSSERVRSGMMLSAAKAWQFEPARMQGRAVRYVVRVLVTP